AGPARIGPACTGAGPACTGPGPARIGPGPARIAPGPACTGPGLTAWAAGLAGAALAAGLCCSSACADIANAASADTSGKYILERPKMLILNSPIFGPPLQHIATRLG